MRGFTSVSVPGKSPTTRPREPTRTLKEFRDDRNDRQSDDQRDDHEAEAVSDVVFLLNVEGDWSVKLVGRYLDVLHHADGAWRFHRREARWADAG